MFRRKKELYIIELLADIPKEKMEELDKEIKKVEKETNTKLFFVNTNINVKPVNTEARKWEKNNREKKNL
jgi:hypothetical protein